MAQDRRKYYCYDNIACWGHSSTLSPQKNLNLCIKIEPEADAKMFVRFLFTHIWPRNQTFTVASAWFQCGDSGYLLGG